MKVVHRPDKLANVLHNPSPVKKKAEEPKEEPIEELIEIIEESEEEPEIEVAEENE